MKNEDVKASVKTQFGRSAADYAKSECHAKGESLGILEKEILQNAKMGEDGKIGDVLDVATGAGHTAHRFAKYAGRVVASDLTQAMLEQTKRGASELGLTNLVIQHADAESLPFPDASFDVVTCRLAFHHFPNPDQAVKEWFRVLRPGGLLGFADNVTVDDPNGQKAYNDFEKLRDPSHVWVSSLPELENRFASVGFEIVRSVRVPDKNFEFHDWSDRQKCSAETKEQLRRMMEKMNPAAADLFRPVFEQETFYFDLWEAVIVARKP